MSETLDDVEKITRMTEWDAHPAWELDENTNVDDSLAAAQRYVAAQGFLLSWQEGRVPVGWQRARRLADFDGAYPQHIVDAALDRINDLIAERNNAATKRIARAARHRKTVEALTPKASKTDVELISQQFGKFSHAVSEMKVAIESASAAVAELTLKTQALDECL